MTETPDWRSRKREETHQRIYETAMRLFRERGFDHVNVGQIASEAGVSVPTFYAHFASKEQVVLQLPPPDAIAGVLADQPADLPVGEKIRRAAPHWFARWNGPERDALLDRWRVIATTPSLRMRAAEYERTTAALVVDALPRGPGGSVPSADSVVATAYLSALTAGLLAWADSNGEQNLEQLVDEAFQALQG